MIKLKQKAMNYKQITLEETATAKGFVPATLHYHEDRQVYLIPVDESTPPVTDADILVEALKNLEKRYSETIDKYLEFSNNAYNRMNPKAADMWKHKRDGFVQAKRDIAKIIAQYNAQ